ncbi:MAG: DUF2807 domain-containing protein [Ferruginibacter sp.]
MTKRLMVLVSSIALLGSCNKEFIRGGGAINSETRMVNPFTNVEMRGGGEATINYGTAQAVSITGYQNLLAVYETKVIGNTLYLQFKSDIYNVRNNNIKVNITLPVLAYLRINGSGKITAKNFADGVVLTASINGSGYIFVGDSKYTKAAYSINGSGDIKAATTTAIEAAAQITGSGNIELNVSNKLMATISGSGNINYWGNPVTAETQVSGSGKITKK